MKKVMKALALALALCMVLSVSAFAAVEKSDATVNKTAHTVAFNITGVGTEQVALLVLKNDVEPSNATESDILFIDQTAGVSGTATFSATIAEGNDVVDVYVGSTSIAADVAAGNGSAWEVYPDLEVAETSGITIAAGTGEEVAKVIAPGEGGTGTVQYGVAIKMNINKINVEKMIWALGDGTTKVYSKPIVLNYSDMAAIQGDTWFTAAVAPSILEGENALTALTTVNAIFRCNNKNYFTDPADELKEGSSEN